MNGKSKIKAIVESTWKTGREQPIRCSLMDAGTNQGRITKRQEANT